LGDLEPQSSIRIEENVHDEPEITTEEHVAWSQQSQGKHILNLAYLDSEDSELEKDEHNKEVSVQELVTTTKPSIKGDKKIEKLQKKIE